MDVIKQQNRLRFHLRQPQREFLQQILTVMYGIEETQIDSVVINLLDNLP